MQSSSGNVSKCQITVLTTAITLALTGYAVVIGSRNSDRSVSRPARDTRQFQRDITDWVEHVLEAEGALQKSKLLVTEGRFEDALTLIDNKVRGVLLDDQAQSELHYLDVRIMGGLARQSEQYSREMQQRRREWMSRNGIN